MSLAAIRNGLYTHLTTCGPFGRTEISTCDFGILDGLSGSGILFLPGATAIIQETYGNQFVRKWGINGQGFVKDTGDSVGTLSRIWQFHDDLYNTLIKDQSLGSASAQAAYLTGINFNVNNTVHYGGPIFFIVDWTMIVEEF